MQCLVAEAIPCVDICSRSYEFSSYAAMCNAVSFAKDRGSMSSPFDEWFPIENMHLPTPVTRQEAVKRWRRHLRRWPPLIHGVPNQAPSSSDSPLVKECQRIRYSRLEIVRSSGSARAARMAGIQQASRATPLKPAETTTNINESVVEIRRAYWIAVGLVRLNQIDRGRVQEHGGPWNRRCPGRRGPPSAIENIRKSLKGSDLP